MSEASTGGVESTETKPSGQKHAIFQSKLPGIARNSRQFVTIRLILSQNLLTWSPRGGMRRLGTCSGQFLCQLAPTLFRPFLAHFCSFFPRFFAVRSVFPARFRKPAPRPGKTVRNGRKTAGKKPQVDINVARSRYPTIGCHSTTAGKYGMTSHASLE